MNRQLKVKAIQLYADHVQHQLEPLAEGLAAQGMSEDDIEATIEGLRPAFDKGVEDVLRQCAVIELQERVNDNNNWAELSIDLLRKGFDRPECNPAILIQYLANGLAIMEQAGVDEIDGKLYLPGEASAIARIHREGRASA